MTAETPAYEFVPGPKTSPLIFLCDHAANVVPAAYGDLGLPAAEFLRHIAWDIGAGQVTRRLAARFDAPAFLGRWSRLLIDLNRGPDDPTLVMKISDGAIVPGNEHADAAEVAHRVAAFHAPYHAAIASRIDAGLAAAVPPTLVSIHSFTPALRGVARPWHVGVLWDRDGRLARPLIDAYAAEPGLVVGDNEPYDGALEGDTLWTHGTSRGLPHALIEIRQDQLMEEADIERLTAITARALIRALAQAGLQITAPG